MTKRRTVQPQPGPQFMGRGRECLELMGRITRHLDAVPPTETADEAAAQAVTA